MFMSITMRRALLAAPLMLAATATGADAQSVAANDDDASEIVADLLGGQHPSRAALTLVFILDGLRPDAINATDTPNLFALRAGGVNFPASHSVFPTVTRCNATALATGSYPARNGIIGNSIYVRASGRETRALSRARSTI